MIKLAVTRFDNNTYKENRIWRESRHYNGCIYGTSIKIKESINPDTILIVFEMNNSINMIEGIGIIKNNLTHKKYNIYNDKNYNRYIYKSNFRFDKLKFDYDMKQIIDKLEVILFTGKKHLKRGHGIQIIDQLLNNFDDFNYQRYFINYFKSYID